MGDLFGRASDPENKSKDKPLRPLTTEEIEKIARNAIENAVDYVDSELTTPRITVDKYYQGLTGLKTVEGRSKVVVTKVRDGVKSVIPSVARIFTQTDTVAQFESDDEEDEKMCEDASAYCNSVFWKADGYKAFIEASIDSLKARIGVIKITLQKKDVPYHSTYNTTDPQDLSMIQQALPPGVMMTEQSATESVFTGLRSKYYWDLSCVPPEEFLVDSNVSSIEKSMIVGHRRPEQISTLIEMGYNYEDLKDIPDYSKDNVEDAERKRITREQDEGTTPSIDPTSRWLLFTEICLRLDADGDGVAELRRLGLVGDNYKLLSDEPINYPNYAVIKSEIQPHVFHPICLAEDLVQDQDAQTALLRSIIDNAALVNNPRTVANETVVNLDDLKNGEIGTIIRVRQMGQVEELVTPFVAGQTLPVLQYLDEVSQKRSGITPLSQGLDPDALQSTTKMAVNAAISGSDARLEMMARNIGETGLKELFLCILRTAMSTIKEKQSINTLSGYQTVNPQWWHDQVSVRINVGLGSGRIDEKKQALTQLLAVQQQTIMQLGLANPICGWNNARATLRDILRLNGIHSVSQYFPFIPPQQLQQFDAQMKQQSAENQKQQQQAQMAQTQAMVDLVKVEQQKSELKYQTEMAKLQQKYQQDMSDLKAQIAELSSRNRIEVGKTILQDDRERDKNDMDFIIDAQKVALDEQKVKVAEQKVTAQRTAPAGGTLQ